MIQLRNRPGRHTAGRTLVIAALLAAAVVPAATAAPLAATAPVTVRSTASAYQQVAHFYGAYIDAAGSEGGGTLTTALRAFYLTPALRSQLRTWEARNHADGVLRAQNTPLAFEVTPGDSGAGHTWSKVRLTWSGGKHPTYTRLTVQSDLRTGRISGIR
ncbi:hypothetical protein [Streptomyces sp900116325]|uniref:hypothetical protein n=1 Tax=Streptomyces sp. 900116325 TaxID=3154295 RepID=UPI003321A846